MFCRRLQAADGFSIIAIMLGRLHMDIETCVSQYLQLSQKVFRPERNWLNVIGKGKDFLTLKGKSSADGLAEEIQKIVKSVEGDSNAELTERNPSARVYVTLLITVLLPLMRCASYYAYKMCFPGGH